MKFKGKIIYKSEKHQSMVVLNKQIWPKGCQFTYWGKWYKRQEKIPNKHDKGEGIPSPFIPTIQTKVLGYPKVFWSLIVSNQVEWLCYLQQTYMKYETNW